jgi:hypothetical protein
VLACELDRRPKDQRFLVESLWSEGAVGIIGGEPKCCKSILALDLAVAVASGHPCLQRFAVARPGPVLLFAAEDALDIVRDRIDGICNASRIPLDKLPLHVITAPTVRLDVERDRLALRATASSLRPRLLVLDPFVRLHRINENAADEVAPLLAFLRTLQRELDLCVALVHHARKRGHARAGQTLRGSSELHAWGDSNLYLRRDRQRLVLTIEHRAAPSPEPLELDLHVDGDHVALRVVASSPEPQSQSVEQRVLTVLAAHGPLSRRALRDACRIRSSTLGDVLAQLLAQGRVAENHRGYHTTSSPSAG